jgi:hypothetical protein
MPRRKGEFMKGSRWEDSRRMVCEAKSYSVAVEKMTEKG